MVAEGPDACQATSEDRPYGSFLVTKGVMFED